MILSMTGYGKSVAEYKGKRITAEIKDGKTTLTINFASAGGKTLKAELQ